MVHHSGSTWYIVLPIIHAMRILTTLLLAVSLVPLVNGQWSCANAQDVGIGNHAVSSLMTGDPPPLSCVSGWGEPTHAAWFRFTASADTAIQVSSFVQGNPSISTRLHVYAGTCGQLVCLAGDEYSGPGFTSQAWFPVTSGNNYYIVWDDLYGATGFHFSVTYFDPPDGVVVFVNTPVPGISNIYGAVDMNNDGMDDLVSPGATAATMAYQQADASYVIAALPHQQADNMASWSFAVGDWDSNGHRDLLYGGGSGATFMRANGTGTSFLEISFPQYIFSQRTNFVDLNNDGHLDAFVCHDVDANVAFLNDGAGNLSFNQGGYGETCGNYGSIFTDIDNDGDQDLFVAKCGCDPADLLMPNNGTGAFTNVAPSLGLNDGHQSWSSAWGDYDNDGDMDVLIGSSGSGVHKLMSNDGDGTFTDVTSGSGMDSNTGTSIEWTAHDFNNDGWIDILGGSGLHYNMGDMTFTHDDSAPYNGPIGDLNNDGFLDIAGSNTYSRNMGNDFGHIRFNLQGVQSNRDGIGARVTITSALGQQIRDIRSGDGFRYMSFIGAHFGLGTDDVVEQVHIRWPSGIEDVILNPAINTTHLIVEGISTSVNTSDETAISVVPNPATDLITVNGVAPNSAVKVLDVAGRLVLQTNLTGGRLDVSALSPGIHQLQLVGKATQEGLRFAKE